MEENYKKVGSIFLPFVIILGIVFRVYAYLQNPSFWFDESALAYNVITLKYTELLGVLHLQQVAPPLFLVLTKWVVSVFGNSELSFRFIPLVVSCATLIPFYYLLKTIFDDNPKAINFGMFLFAINPKMAYFGSEFKPYILDVFFAILIFWVFLKINLKSWSWKKLALTGLGLALSVWFSFTSVIVVCVGMLTLLISQKDEIKNWLILLAPIICNYLIFAIYYLSISRIYSDFMSDFFSGEFNHFTIPVAYFFNNEIPFAIMITSIALVAGIIYFMAEKKKFEISFIMWTFIVTVALSQLHLYPAYQRFMIFLLPYTIIILSMVFALLLTKKNFQSRLVLIFILLSLVPISVNYKPSEARDLTQYMIQNLNEDDLIVVDSLALPDFLFYTHNVEMKNKIIAPFDKKDGKLMYKLESKNNFPTEYDNFWFYSTRMKDFDKVIKKDGNVELLNDYKITNKMITRNGGVFKLMKNEE